MKRSHLSDLDGWRRPMTLSLMISRPQLPFPLPVIKRTRKIDNLGGKASWIILDTLVTLFLHYSWAREKIQSSRIMTFTKAPAMISHQLHHDLRPTNSSINVSVAWAFTATSENMTWLLPVCKGLWRRGLIHVQKQESQDPLDRNLIESRIEHEDLKHPRHRRTRIINKRKKTRDQ